jgi:DNA-binding MarR family transcriptional regulator
MAMKTPPKYHHILELIGYWQEFEELECTQGREAADFTRFAVWLSRRIQDEKLVNTDVQLAKTNLSRIQALGEYIQEAKKDIPAQKNSKTKSKKIFEEELENNPEWRRAQGFESKVKTGEENVLEYHKYLPLESQISALLTRMNRFSMFYVKKAFQGLDISNATEFGILAGIRSLGNPRKTDVINLNLLEKTTGTELIKRLVNDGLVSETDDEDDKRSKRLQLTKKGEAAVDEGSKRLWSMSIIVTGNLAQEQKHELAQMLNELGDFHNNIYFQQADLSIEEIIAQNIVKVQE